MPSTSDSQCTSEEYSILSLLDVVAVSFLEFQHLIDVPRWEEKQGLIAKYFLCSNSKLLARSKMSSWISRGRAAFTASISCSSREKSWYLFARWQMFPTYVDTVLKPTISCKNSPHSVRMKVFELSKEVISTIFLLSGKHSKKDKRKIQN